MKSNSISTMPIEPPVKNPLVQQKKFNWIMFLIIFIGIIFIFGVGLFIGLQYQSKNNSIKIIAPTPIQSDNNSAFLITPTIYISNTQTVKADDCVNDKINILSKIDEFENFQKNKDAGAVLKLFTPPQAQNDIDDFRYLSGADTNSYPRLYNNVTTRYDTISYKVIGDPVKDSDNNCNVAVQEQRSYYGGPANPQNLPAVFEDFILIFVKRDGVWMIDQYYFKDPQVNKTKYRGFGWE